LTAKLKRSPYLKEGRVSKSVLNSQTRGRGDTLRQAQGGRATRRKSLNIPCGGARFAGTFAPGSTRRRTAPSVKRIKIDLKDFCKNGNFMQRTLRTQRRYINWGEEQCLYVRYSLTPLQKLRFHLFMFFPVSPRVTFVSSPFDLLSETLRLCVRHPPLLRESQFPLYPDIPLRHPAYPAVN